MLSNDVFLKMIFEGRDIEYTSIILNARKITMKSVKLREDIF